MRFPTLCHLVRPAIPGLAGLFAHAAPVQQPLPTVRTTSGALRGALKGDGAVFKGIPYVAAPTGANRWRPPQPHPGWPGVRDARQYCTECPRAGGPRGAGMAKNSAEDCLFLNA